MLIVLLVLGAVFLLAGVGRTLYKGQYNSLRDVLLTVFFLDMVFDDWDTDSDVTDLDF